VKKRRLKKSLRTFFRRLKKLVLNPVFLGLTLFGNLVIAVSAVSLYLVERQLNPTINSLLDTVWWSVSTVSTVGYGDVSPVTPIGRIIGIFTMIIGTALFWSYTALFAEALVSKDISDLEEELRSTVNRLKALKLEEDAGTDEVKALLRELEMQITETRSRRHPAP
jgi:voltage-gated potassium channel